MDPISATTVALGSKAAGSLAEGMMANSSSRAQALQAERQAHWAGTRAIQTDTVARQGLESELGTMRAVFASNQSAPSVGTLEIMQDLRKTRDRERRINVGNHRSQEQDYRTQAANARYQGRIGLLSGLIKAGPSMFDMYENQKGPS